MTTKRSPLRMLAAACMLAAGVTILIFVLRQSDVANRDFIDYWAAGRQILSHQNPYDAEAVRALQVSAGFRSPRWALARNPPHALLLWMVLGSFAPRAGAVFWSLLSIAALMASIRMVWVMQGRPPDRLHLVGYCFAPSLCCILAGQVGILMLLGFTLFLWLQRDRPYLAGCALLLCSIKPHLFGPFAVVLLAWSVATRRFKVLAGAAAAIVVCSLAPLFFDPHVFHHYLLAMRAEDLDNEFIPTVSLFLRLAVHRSAIWLQFVPLLLSLAWALHYYWKRRDAWDWRQHGPVLAAVGVLAAPYAWVTDEVLALPAVLAALYAAARGNLSLLPFFAISCIGLLEVFAGVEINSGFYLWTAPTWVAWYAYVVYRCAYLSGDGRSSEGTIPA